MIDKIIKYKLEFILSIFIIIYIFVFSYLSIIRYLSFNSHYYDLGIMNQVVYNTAQGRFLEMTNPDNTQNLSRLAIHFDPVLAVFAPLYKFIKATPIILLIAQTIIIALGAIGVYLLAILVLKKRIYGLFFAFLYLNYYQLQFANLFDFHATLLLPALLIFIFYFWETKKYKAAFVLFLVSLLVKENVGLITLFMSLYFFIIKKERKLSLLISIISLVVFFSLVFYIIPYFRQGQHFALKYYSLNINTIIHQLFSFDSLDYIFRVLEPVGFLAILSPFTLLIAVPEFLINLLSSNDNMRVFYFHYTAGIIPFIFIASIYGLKKIIDYKKLYLSKVKLRWLIIVVLLINLYSAIRYGPFIQLNFSINQEKLQTVSFWQQRLSDERISVSTTPQLAPFFTNRKYYYNFLYDTAFADMGLTENDIIKNVDKYTKADYVVIALSEVNGDNLLVKQFYLHLKSNKLFKIIYIDRNIEVYRKTDIR